MPAIVTQKRTPAQNFIKRMVELKNVQHIQDDLRSQTRKNIGIKIAFLNQAYILHMVAFWQAFFEDLVDYGGKVLGSGVRTHPGFGKTAAARRGARSKFNTPNAEEIDKLINRELQIPRISHSWHWDGVTYDAARGMVAEILNIRHEIAHKGRDGISEEDIRKGVLPLSYSSNYEPMEFLVRLAQITEKEVLRRLSRPADHVP